MITPASWACNFPVLIAWAIAWVAACIAHGLKDENRAYLYQTQREAVSGIGMARWVGLPTTMELSGELLSESILDFNT
jgi:hypothetical protein